MFDFQSIITSLMMSAHLAGDNPLLLGGLLALTTFLFEDVAIAFASGFIMHGALTPKFAFLALVLGIATGDVALYGLGRGARRVGRLKRFLGGQRLQTLAQRLDDNLVSAVLVARVIPGLRTATYTAAGLFASNLTTFVLTDLVAVSLWTAGLLFVGLQIVQVLAMGLGLPPILAAILLALLIASTPLLLRLVWQPFASRLKLRAVTA